MKRFGLALLLSLIIHAALLALLQGGREPTPVEIMRISLSELAGERGGDILTEPVEYVAAVTPVSAPTPEPAPVPAPTTPPAIIPVPAPVPVSTPAPAPTPQPEPEPMPTPTTPQPVPTTVPTPAPEPTPEPDPIPAPALAEEPSGALSANQQDIAGQAGSQEVTIPPAPPGDVIIDASLLRVTRRVPAEYPMISRRRRDQGTVVLILSIQSGRVTRVEVERSSGHSALDEAARRAAAAWEFDMSGFGDSISARIPFVFSLAN